MFSGELAPISRRATYIETLALVSDLAAREARP